MATEDAIRELIILIAKRRGDLRFEHDQEFQQLVILAIQQYNESVEMTDIVRRISVEDIKENG